MHKLPPNSLAELARGIWVIVLSCLYNQIIYDCKNSHVTQGDGSVESK